MPKTLLLLVFMLVTPCLVVGQTTAELSKEVADLKQKVAALEQRLDLVISLLNKQGGTPAASLAAPPTTTPPAATWKPAPVQSALPAAGASRIQCQATTKKGTQCLRLASAGNSYCWQHAR